MDAPSRDLYGLEAARAIPKILTLLDRNPLSPTYGCFDRSYWHYRTMDFPCGMSQEFTLPLALAHALPFPGNRFAGNARMREFSLAGVDYARRSAHRDGSCDDYYPGERALGAVAFSLYACAESLLLLDAHDEALVRFVRQRARYAAAHGETGTLANHHAIAALALHLASLVTGDAGLRVAARRKLEEVLALQHEEGWFLEYEGCDPGYLTVTIDFLARLRVRLGDTDEDSRKIDEALGRAVRFLAEIAPPDGSLGGEYGSRNTYLFMPHGLEILAAKEPAARHLADLCLKGLSAGTGARLEDDRLVGHPVYSYAFAWRDAARREGTSSFAPHTGRRILPGAGLLVDRTGDRVLVASLRKGGAFKLWKSGALVSSDSGIAVRCEDGTVASASAAPTAAHAVEGDTVSVKGPLHRVRRPLMSPAKLLVFRILTLGLGRLGRNLIRRLLQRKLILGRKEAGFTFTRRFTFQGKALTVRDELIGDGRRKARSILLPTTETAIYVAMSNPHQDAFLLQPADLTALAPSLATAGRIAHERWF